MGPEGNASLSKHSLIVFSTPWNVLGVGGTWMRRYMVDRYINEKTWSLPSESLLSSKERGL